MARSSEVHGPWRIEGGHPDGPEHVGSVVSMDAEGEVDPSGETVPAVTRRAVCSCGWSGPLHDAPRAEGALIVRRYRKQSREELAPQWREHVAQWVPAPLDGPGEGQDTGKPRRRRQKPAEAPQAAVPETAGSEVVAPTVPEPEAAAEPVAEVPVPGLHAKAAELGDKLSHRTDVLRTIREWSGLGEEPTAERPADPSDALAVAAERAQAANLAASRAADELTDAVRAARAAGVSWRKVGLLVGTSGQAAHERWRSA